jgi:DUF1680 family protein
MKSEPHAKAIATLVVVNGILLLALCLSPGVTGPAAGSPRGNAPAISDYPVQPVPFTAVKFQDAFWLPRIETNRSVTIPFAFEQCEKTGRVDHLVRAAAALRGEKVERKLPGYPFDDTDIYKVIEGAAYTLSVHPDPQLEAYIDGLVEKIAAAQEPDGYLYPARTIWPAEPHRWAGPERWVLEKVNSHELYNLGHLYEAAIAYFQATGKRKLLDVSLKTADLLDSTFGPGKKSIWPGHQITEMALARLYRITGDARYLNLAKFLLDVRGPDGDQGSGRTYNQSHVPVVQQAAAVGHAVRATYMYSGMADVAALAGDSEYVRAMDAIWQDVVGRKLYITGGIGARGSGEAFGGEYELPNMSAYAETCAAIGNVYWNHRLFLLHGDARYVDVMERGLYNGVLSGVALDGKSFFYPNPLESNGQHQRSPWFGVACCPSNMTRFLASVPGYVYAQQGDAVYVNLFVDSTAEVRTESAGTVRLKQETRYPWEGTVRIHVAPERSAEFVIRVRIPGWAREEAVPSDLYHFADAPAKPAVLQVNGKRVALQLEKGYAALKRKWQAGDQIALELPMPVRRVAANEKVEADRQRVALQRGPIVYAAEWADNPGGKVRNLLLPTESRLTAALRPELLNGVVAVQGESVALAYDAAGQVQQTKQPFTAIPYHVWANRGRGQMAVWIPSDAAAVRPAAFPTIATTSKVSTSGRKYPGGINDGEEPRNSLDMSSFFDWWPTKGSTEWVEYAFAKTETVSEVEVYWFDDTGRGEVRVPQSWRVLYKDGNEWRPVENAGPYGVAKDGYNKVAFQPVTTGGLRLEVTLQPNWSAGVLEWKVK